MQKISRNVITLLLVSSLFACVSLAYKSPSSVNLSGEWALDATLSQAVLLPRNKKVRNAQRGGGERGGGRAKRREKPEGTSSNTTGGSQVQRGPDAIVATNMIIEHVSDSMGVLYQSGNYRDIDWGVTEGRRATITAGWRGDSLVVKTKGQRRTITEIYSLAENNEMLIVQFEVGGETYTRVYRRKTSKSITE